VADRVGCSARGRDASGYASDAYGHDAAGDTEEVRGALERWRRATEEVQIAICLAQMRARLVEIGLIDDERFAQALLDSRDRSRQRGDRALLQELRRRGIDEELAQRLLAQRAAGEALSTEPVWGVALRVVEEHAEGAEERAARAALAKLRLRGGDVRAEVQRLAQGLARRGFPSALSWRLARERVEAQARIPLPEGDEEAE
jgi:regulatory protein